MSLGIVIGKISKIERAYIAQKFEAFFGKSVCGEEFIDFFLSERAPTPNPFSVSLASENDFPKESDEEELQRIRDGKACLLREVNAKFILAEGERIVEDFFSFTTSRISYYFPGTPVLKRTTNFGEFYFLSNESKVIGGRLVDEPLLPDACVSCFSQEEAGAAIMVLILKQLATGFITSIGKQCGEALLSKLFGANGMSTTELCQELEKYIKDVITEAMIEKESGAINSALLYVTTDYKFAKESGESSEKLLLSLGYQHVKINEALEVLSEELCLKKGISVYTVGASINLSILQEKAQLEAVSKKINIEETPSYKSFLDYTKLYHEHVSKVKKDLWNDRKSDVSIVCRVPNCCYVASDVTCNPYYMFKDSFNNHEERDWTRSKHETDEQVISRLNEKRDSYIKELEKGLDWMDIVVLGWQAAISSKYIVETSEAKCLDVEKGQYTSDTAIIEYKKHGNANQIFSFVPINSSDKSYFIFSRLNGLVLAAEPDAAKLYAPLLTKDLSLADNQIFSLNLQNDKPQKIICLNKYGKALDVSQADKSLPPRIVQGINYDSKTMFTLKKLN